MTPCKKQSVDMMQIHSILYATDFSKSSKVAFSLACSIARDHQARLIVLHVVPAGTYEIVNLAQLGHGESMGEFEDDIRNELQQLQPPDNRVPMEYKLANGDAVASIVKEAEDTHCDLIVLGTHGRTGLRRLLMGSVAENVVRTAPCPVLVVKAPVQQASSSALTLANAAT
jgi:nucleotide-binding universal stress UspA family protein